MGLFGKKHIAETGDGVDNGSDAEILRGKGAVDHAFDGEMMDQVRLFFRVDLLDPADGFNFTGRIDALAGKIKFNMAETGFFQLFDVVAAG